MGLGSFIKSVFNVNGGPIWNWRPVNMKPLELVKPVYYQQENYDVKPNFIYFSKNEQHYIDNQFKDLDGYFTKLISKDNKLIGYVFRCTHRNVEITLADGTIKKYPYFVTCYYQQLIPGMSQEITKTIGKAHAVKSGLRIVKSLAKYAQNNEIYEEDMHHFDFDYAINLYTFIFDVETEDKANTIIDYVKSFDSKIYKYYNEVSKENIKTIWLSSTRNYEI